MEKSIWCVQVQIEKKDEKSISFHVLLCQEIMQPLLWNLICYTVLYKVTGHDVTC